MYCSARAPDANEDYAALAKTYPTPPASEGLVHNNGFSLLSEEAFLRDFAGDVDPVTARALYAVQGAAGDAISGARVTQAAWRTKPSFFQVSTEDRTIDPDLERFMAKRMNAKTIELKSSHLGIISHPREIASLSWRQPVASPDCFLIAKVPREWLNRGSDCQGRICGIAG